MSSQNPVKLPDTTSQKSRSGPPPYKPPTFSPNLGQSSQTGSVGSGSQQRKPTCDIERLLEKGVNLKQAEFDSNEQALVISDFKSRDFLALCSALGDTTDRVKKLTIRSSEEFSSLNNKDSSNLNNALLKHPIEVLVFSACKLESKEDSEFIQHIGNLPFLHTLELQDYNSFGDNFPALIEMIRKSSLTSFSCDGDRTLSDNDKIKNIKFFSNILSESKLRIVIFDNFLNPPMRKLLLAQGPNYKNLRELSIKNGGESEKASGEIAQWIKSPDCKLTKFNISETGLTDGQIKLICAALAVNKSIIELVMQGVGLGSKNIEFLKEALEKNRTLRTLTIGNETYLLLQPIVAALKNNRTLESFKVSESEKKYVENKDALEKIELACEKNMSARPQWTAVLRTTVLMATFRAYLKPESNDTAEEPESNDTAEEPESNDTAEEPESNDTAEETENKKSKTGDSNSNSKKRKEITDEPEIIPVIFSRVKPRPFLFPQEVFPKVIQEVVNLLGPKEIDPLLEKKRTKSFNNK